MKTTLALLLALFALNANALDVSQPAALVRDNALVQTFDSVPTRTRHIRDYNGSLRLLPTERLLAMGWRQHVKADAPAEGYEVASIAVEITDTEYIETATYRTIEEGDAIREAEWQASPEYAARVKALTLAGGIGQILAAVQVQPTTRDEVFAAVRAHVRNAEDGSPEKTAALETALDLATLYRDLTATLAAYGETPDGLLNGSRQINTGVGTPFISDTD